MNIATLSDLHIGASPETYQRVCRAVNRIITHYSPADTLVALCGDITENGTRAEYRLARDTLSPLVARGYRVLAVPGNHDYGPLGNRYSRDAHQYWGQYIAEDVCETAPQYPLVWHVDGQRIIGLDSCYSPQPTNGLWEALRERLKPSSAFANGEIGRGQLDALSAWLEDDIPTHVILHHHPLYVMPGMQLVDAHAFWEVVGGRVQSVHFGHRHKRGQYDGHKGIERVRAHGSTGHQGYMDVWQL
jgi:3',5'-cyclic AMP phosphodiesterase CpdA